MSRLVLENLRVKRDGLAILDGLSLDVPPKSLTMVVGPSGAGKTRLTRVVVGLDPIDEGEIYLDGRAVHRLKPLERKIGWISSEDSLWSHWNIWRNIGFGPRMLKLSGRERRRRVVEAMTLVGIDSLANRKPGELTAAQRLRAEIARALALEPLVLVLDDPFMRLPRDERSIFIEDLRRIQRESELTVLATSREPASVWSRADLVAVVDLGEIVQVGKPRDLYYSPRDSFVAQFVGSVNLIQGCVESIQEGGWIVMRTPLGLLRGRGAPAAVGSPVTAAVRPESFEIVVDRSATDAGQDALENRFVATFLSEEFLGPERRWSLRGPGAWPLTTVSLSARAVTPSSGEAISIQVPPEFVRVLATRGRSGA